MSNWQEIANTAWVKRFEEGPFTTLQMVEHLLGKIKSSYTDLLKFPTFLKRVPLELIHQDQMEEELHHLWAGKTGRCTSFALYVASHLETNFPKGFSFNIYDISGHRLASCPKTGILVDSSCRRGAMTLKEGLWTYVPTGEGWCIQNGTLFFSRNQKLKSSSEVVSPKDALTQCLLDLRTKLSMLTLFGSYKDGETKYHGMITWELKKLETHLIIDIDRRDDKVVISWKESNPAETSKKASSEVEAFVRTHGGPHWERQWRETGAKESHEAI